MLNKWNTIRLRNCLLSRPDYGANASAVDYIPELTLRYIRITDIDESGRLIEDKKVGIPINEGNDYRLKDGDLLVARTGATVGKSFFYGESLGPCAFAGYLIRLRVNHTKLSANFLRQYLMSPLFWKWVHGTVRVGAQPNISAEEYASMPIPIFPIQVQQTIAAILSTWDKAIEQMQKLIDTKTRLKKGLMQQLLTGKRRFKELDEDWQEVRLGDMFIERKETGRIDLSLISITSERGVISRGTVDRKDTSNEDKSKYKRIAHGDIGYNTMRMWQGVSGLSTIEGIVSPAYTILIPSDKMNAIFASYLFKYAPLIHLFYRYSQGLVDDTRNLKYHNFAQIKVKLPKLKEQNKIAEVFESIDDEIDALKKCLLVFQNQKKGLMQVLLTGKVRVKVKGG